MAIQRKNKFEDNVAELEKYEAEAQEKNAEVVKKITGKRGKRGRPARQEERKALPTYIPMSLYEDFNKITTAYGISNNAAICQLIRDYVDSKRDML